MIGHDGASCSDRCASICDHPDCKSCRRAKVARARSELLKTLPNPERDSQYSVVCKTPELTFLGKEDQPDFGVLTIAYSPRRVILELKSLKKYVQSFSGHLFSYERLVNTIYDEVWEALSRREEETYDDPPRGLVVTIELHSRGGIETVVQRGAE